MVPTTHTPAGRKEFTTPPRKLRLAIGLFAGRAEACATARELCDMGLWPARISLAATPEVLGGCACDCSRDTGSGNPDCDARNPFGGLHYKCADAQRLCRTDAAGCCGTFLPIGPFASQCLEAEMGTIAAALNEHLGSRSMRHQERKLYEHLAARRWLLVVQLGDTSQDHDVCTSLLRGARHGVQTHEIRMC